MTGIAKSQILVPRAVVSPTWQPLKGEELIVNGPARPRGGVSRPAEREEALSAGLRLYVAGLAGDPLQGAREARAALADGRGQTTLAALLAP